MSRRITLAVLALVGTIGIASADPLVSTGVTIWDGVTTGNTSTSPGQQGLPTAVVDFGGPLTLLVSNPTYSAPINYNLATGGSNTIAGFFASNTPSSPAPCANPCASTLVSDPTFLFATVFEFTFTLTEKSLLSFTHDDGISLFLQGTETLDNANDLLALAASSPTTAELTSVIVGPGTYDLWYAAANGLPEILKVDATPVPAPIVGAGLPGLIMAGGGLLGWRRRKQKRQAA